MEKKSPPRRSASLLSKPLSILTESASTRAAADIVSPTSPNNGRSRVADGLARRSFSTTRRSDTLRRIRSTWASSADDKAHALRYKSDAQLDPLALVVNQPAQVSGPLSTKSRAGVRGWERAYAELRGCMVVLAFETVAKPADGAVTLGPSYPIDATVNVLGCEIISKRGANVLRLKKPKSPHVLVLKFDSSADCGRWEHFLEEAASQRYVTVADFKVLSRMSSTSPCTYYKVRDRFSGDALEMKVVDKVIAFKDPHSYKRVLDERLAYELAEGRPMLRQLRYAFQGPSKLYMVYEECPGGSLESYLLSYERMSENCARRVLAEMVVALETLHAQGIVHRAIEPANVLLDADGHIKLANFDRCEVLTEAGSGVTLIPQKASYAAPEMLSLQSYGTSVDLWMMGALLFQLLQGREVTNPSGVSEELKPEVAVPVSSECGDMIRGFLNNVPELRLGSGLTGLAEVRSHPFFKNVKWNGVRRREEHRDGLRLKTEKEPSSTDESYTGSPATASLDFGTPLEKLHTVELFTDVTLWPLTRFDRHVIEDRVAVGWFYSRGRASDVVQ